MPCQFMRCRILFSYRMSLMSHGHSSDFRPSTSYLFCPWIHSTHNNKRQIHINLFILSIFKRKILFVFIHWRCRATTFEMVNINFVDFFYFTVEMHSLEMRKTSFSCLFLESTITMTMKKQLNSLVSSVMAMPSFSV